MEHIKSKNSPESKLQICSICSIRIRFVFEGIEEFSSTLEKAHGEYQRVILSMILSTSIIATMMTRTMILSKMMAACTKLKMPLDWKKKSRVHIDTENWTVNGMREMKTSLLSTTSKSTSIRNQPIKISVMDTTIHQSSTMTFPNRAVYQT